MSNTPTFSITGKSGKVYTFYIHKLPVNFQAVSGVYLFTKLLDNGQYQYIYLGITKDLSERFDDHHKADCISRNGATHLCAFTEESEETRKYIEKDIMAVISTKCNGLLN